MSREEYWCESLSEILEGHNVELPVETIKAIAKDLVITAEMESEIMGHSCIPNPFLEEIKKLKEARKQDKELAERREEIYRKDIAGRISPRTDSRQVLIRDGLIEIWRQ